jgi:hypothetical protein
MNIAQIKSLKNINTFVNDVIDRVKKETSDSQFSAGIHDTKHENVFEPVVVVFRHADQCLGELIIMAAEDYPVYVNNFTEQFTMHNMNEVITAVIGSFKRLEEL